jgi:uncharacterized membrane protein (UPF0127 family)
MKYCTIVNAANDEIIAEHAGIADTLLSRFRGLLGSKQLPHGRALIIRPCKQVHMFFMHYPLDIVFCSQGNIVLSLQENLRPWRISRRVLDASSIIELPAGSIQLRKIHIGDTVRFLSAEPPPK